MTGKISKELLDYADSLGWIYGKYDDQHFHKFETNRHNSISPEAMQQLYQNRQRYAQKYADKIIGEDEESKARSDKLRQSPPWQRNQCRADQRNLNNDMKGKL